jgi:hypothetical protein
VEHFLCVCVTEMEERNFEERFTIKFYVKLVETGIETSKKLKQTYGGMLCRNNKCSSGIRNSQRTVNP